MFYRTTRPNLYDYIKIIAIVLMIMDHVGYFLFPEQYWIRVLGRYAMPIFLFLVGLNGFYRRSWGLFWGAITAQCAWVLYFFSVASGGGWLMNILVVILLARVVLYGVDYVYRRFSTTLWLVIVLSMVAILFISHHFLVSWIDYGSFGLLWALWGHICYRLSDAKWSLVGFFTLYVPFLIYQHEIFGPRFNEMWRIWVWVGSLWTSFALWRVATHNDILRLGQPLDSVVVWMSSQALRLYIYHVVLLAIGGTLLRVIA